MLIGSQKNIAEYKEVAYYSCIHPFTSHLSTHSSVQKPFIHACILSQAIYPSIHPFKSHSSMHSSVHKPFIHAFIQAPIHVFTHASMHGLIVQPHHAIPHQNNLSSLTRLQDSFLIFLLLLFIFSLLDHFIFSNHL